MRRAALVVSLALLQGGCAGLAVQVAQVDPDTGLPPEKPEESPVVDAAGGRTVGVAIPGATPSSRSTTGAETGAANAGRVGPACLPDKPACRIRDLTRPWRQRRYLLPDGRLCRPGGAAE